ncbi:hypothetical protein EW146_g1457 [Bondarzewia mesenterica]|uniref:Uncharacterized protein n=1 Tax=Bondarzewia mesenterica TaxID=1095465 RepID=A0A4S4M9Z8_9AGAM|nr:hypothetical protein EW146_g1457 [Bondarzewia mesenterica]
MDSELRPKRVLTDDSLSSRTSSFTTSASSLISDDLAARLQNVGTRVRKSVTEGYATDRLAPGASTSRVLSRIASTPHRSANGQPVFQSSFDIIHAVYSEPMHSTTAPSVLKRSRGEAIMDEVDGDADEDEDMEKGGNMADAELRIGSPYSANHVNAGRPIKPLRRTAREFRQTQSLPAATFRTSLISDTHDGNDTISFGNGIEEEEDWSAANFSGGFLGSDLKPI